MAGRRCFSEKVVESDAFYKLPETAQALYFHLNLYADDDGFINRAGSIAGRIKGGKAALRKLVDSRFLLQYDDVYVVKHWRISNSLKNDRLKPLNYPTVAQRLWVKANRSYTDHEIPGCTTLFETKTGIHLESTGNPSGIHLESVWNPNLTEPNLTEPNRTQPNRTEPDWVGVGFQKLWDIYPQLRRGNRKTAEDAYKAVILGEAEAQTALASLEAWKQSAQWAKEDGRYVPYMSNWFSKGLWEQEPASGNAEPRRLDEDERAAIAALLAENHADTAETQEAAILPEARG